MRTRLWFAGFFALLVVAGCAHPPKPRIDSIYRGLDERLPRLDPELLRGRRIVVDPGHGGRFDGTHGQEGLAEASVNLGVSLYLWGLLHEAGADVYLTRSAEKDLLAGADTTVSADLHVRVDMIASIRPDIVVSIHHNAQPLRDPHANAVETYFKMGDPASRDLAFAVHRHLVRNLGIAVGTVRAGNYYILRESAVPAILGEASYLTHPEVEENLRLSEKQRLEAEAYFLGILDYFSRGTPVIEERAPAPGDSIFSEVPTLSYALTDVGGIGIDPAGIEMLVNGVSVRPVLDAAGTALSYELPWESPNGVYDVALHARNLLGNSSRLHSRKFVLSLPAKSAVFSADPEGIPSGGGVVYVRARLLDRRGLSVADGTRVAVAAWTRASREGDWRPFLREDDRWADVRVASGVAEFPLAVPAGTSAVRVAVSPQGDFGHDRAPKRTAETSGFEFLIASSPSAVAGRSVVLLNSTTGEPVGDALFTSGDGQIPVESRCGRFVMSGAGAPSGEVQVEAPGYRPASLSAGTADTLYLEPWYGGKLIGARFVVNPEAGPESARGRLGLSGTVVDLAVARYLREYLETAGARVALTRTAEQTPPDGDVVALTNQFRADEYIEIRYRNRQGESAGAVQAYYFPGSQKGRSAAETVSGTMARKMGIPPLPPSELVTFPLQHTACPAIIIEPPSLDRIEEELRLAEPWYQREQAFGVFCGLLRQAGVEDEGALLVELSPSHGQGQEREARSNWLVIVDDTWRLLTDPDGVARFHTLPAGTHRVVARRADRTIGPTDVTLAEGERRTLTLVIPAER